MSLDVYLTVPGVVRKYEPTIYVRENGRTTEISRDEWDRRNPGVEPATFTHSDSNEVFSRNITHNLNKMATEAGIYKHLWRPDEIGITKAIQLIVPLAAGLALLLTEPKRFEAFNPNNGWGDYEGLCDFVRQYLKACVENPDADVEVSR